MTQPDDLMLASGMLSLALWTLAYLLIIRRGQLDRTYGMPFVALCPTLAYELTYGLIEPNVPPLHIVNIVWFVVDLVIAAQYLRFGRRELSPLVPGWLFVPRFLLITGLWVLAALFAMNLSFAFHLHRHDAFKIAAALGLVFRGGRVTGVVGLGVASFADYPPVPLPYLTVSIPLR